MPTPRSQQSSSSKPKPTLEILPDRRFIVFHGSEYEAAPVILTGRVRLTTPEAISILKPKVRLEGKRKIKWYGQNTYGVNHRGIAEKKQVFYNFEQKLGVDTAHKVKAGVMEWPFEFELSPSMPESVEGLKETYVAYHLRASVSRPGWNSKDVMAEEHIRIVRTLGPEALGMTRSRVNADVWTNKMSYCISIPSDSIVFGTSINAEVQLSPIKKGLKMGKVELRLMETVVKRIEFTDYEPRPDAVNTEEKEVARMDMEFPEHSRITYEDETAENPILADEMYKFNATLPLPQTLNECRQDVEFHTLTITHRFKLMVNIHNPEGHISQLVCRLPVKLFISPSLPLNESNEVHHAPDRPSDAELNSAETTLAAPPQYGQHQLDQIYSDLDPGGFMSRGGSASATPSGLTSQSRRGSGDNLQSLNGLTSLDAAEGHGSATPQQLQARLEGLNLEEGETERSGVRIPSVAFARAHGSTSPSILGSLDSNISDSPTERNARQGPPVRAPSASFGPSRSIQTSEPASRRVSDEDHASDIPQSSYNMDNLSRVPSYGAALRTSGTVTPLTEGPPSYLHVINNGTGSSTPTPTTSQSTLTNALTQTATLTQGSSEISTPQPRQPQPAAPQAPGSQEDEEARLRMLRARN